MGPFSERFRQTFDWRFLVWLTILVLVSTLCYGFVDRGSRLTAADVDRHRMNDTVSLLLARNEALLDQIDQVQRAAAKQSATARHDAEQAARQRDRLAVQLETLNSYLRANGIRTPSDIPHTSTPPATEPSTNTPHKKPTSEKPTSAHTPASAPGLPPSSGVGVCVPLIPVCL